MSLTVARLPSTRLEACAAAGVGMAAKISAFADEISEDPLAQVRTLQSVGIRYVELRGAWGINVLKLSGPQVRDLRKIFSDNGLKVSCIASPIGKVRIDESWDRHFDDFKHAVDLAGTFGCTYVRLFSYYPTEGGLIEPHRDEVIRRLRQQAEYVANGPVTLALENETDLYGDTPQRCAELLAALSGMKVTMAFDPANFVHIDQVPVYERCWLPLRQYVGYFHMKDHARQPDKHSVPVGQGEGDCLRILRDAAASRYDGFLAVEPHLSKAGQFSGFSGPDLFVMACRALQDLCRTAGLPVE
jgi:sugar phosphate isomerase/epimerase